MKRIAIAALLVASFVATGTGHADAEVLAPEAVQRLVDATGGRAQITMHRATGAARFVRLDPGALVLEGATPAERATDFLARHGEVFGITDPASELDGPLVRVDRYEARHMSYSQLYRGLPVFAGELRVHFDADDRLTAVNGTFLPGIDVDVRPTRSLADASRLAREDVTSRLATPPAVPLEVHWGRLVVFRSGLVQRVEGRDHLAWEIRIGNGRDVRETLYVDAHTGKIVDRIAGVHTALDRRIHEGQYNELIIWSEGDPLPYESGDPTNDAQVNGLIDFSDDMYDLFSNLSGGSFLSWDGADATLHSVWKTTSLSCPNASWNGTTTNYCDGVASDDVVAHEWTHAYTERTHGLIYQWQPGALNESYSDIFGEVIDFINGAGTDSPGPTRASGDCSTFGGSPPPQLEVLEPEPIAGGYFAAGANFNPPPPLSVTADVELVDDASGSETDACQPLVGFTPGRIALMDRGNCNFSSKVERAQNAGAVGAIVVNYNDNAFTMGGSNPSITIPALMVSSSDGQLLKDNLEAGVVASIEIGSADANSVRWLTGEDSFGFGGPIRDLWNPICFGDPDKVSAVQYWCGSGDSGGVHTNSGVPNHGFSLLVDGGEFNGHVIDGIGLTKAAHVYWRAMSVYQVPDSDFADHADALAQSCTDLIGVNLADLLTGAPSLQVLSAADCDSVVNATLAVEMQSAPPCNFQPLLDPDAPPFVCGAVATFEDFETDPTAEWTLSNEGVYPEYVPRDWVWTSDLPEGGTGSAFFALDSLTIGNCVEGDDDQSGVMFLESPQITLGGDATVAFDHWVATEPSYDGGNLEISVNGGPYTLVAGDDFTFNRYNMILESSEGGNTNPMAGEEAFSGSDGGEVDGSWGQSHADLAAYASPGDTIRLRFDFGFDGCNGLVGWYVDNLLVCTAENGAGRVPDGSSLPGTQLTVGRDVAGVTLDWGASCAAGDSDYEVYEGTIGSFASHESRLCSTSGATTATLTPSAESSYYLVVPRNADREGSYGADSAGTERPQGGNACLPQALAFECN